MADSRTRAHAPFFSLDIQSMRIYISKWCTLKYAQESYNYIVEKINHWFDHQNSTVVTGSTGINGTILYFCVHSYVTRERFKIDSDCEEKSAHAMMPLQVLLMPVQCRCIF